MKTKPLLLAFALACVSLLSLRTSYSDTVYVNSFDYQTQQAVIRAYDSNTGSVINSFAPVSGLPNAMVVVGGFLYQGSVPAYRVYRYDASTGGASVGSFTNGGCIALAATDSLVYSADIVDQAVYGVGIPGDNFTGYSADLSLMSGFSQAIVVSGSILYVATDQGYIGQYNASTGAAINSNFITGLNNPNAMVISGNDLYVLSFGRTVGRYNATTGSTINDSFITGLNQPQGLAISGSTLFVGSWGDGTVGLYNASTGATINSNFISGFDAVGVIATGPSIVPEPSTCILFLLGGLALATSCRRWVS